MCYNRCYRCQENGHITTDCPLKDGSMPRESSESRRSRSASPRRQPSAPLGRSDGSHRSGSRSPKRISTSTSLKTRSQRSQSPSRASPVRSDGGHKSRSRSPVMRSPSPRSKTRSTSSVGLCYKCGQSGHQKRDCPQIK